MAADERLYLAGAAALAALAVGGRMLGEHLAAQKQATAPPAQAYPTSYEAQARESFLVQADGHQQVCLPEQHFGGYVYEKHRYPRAVGGEVSALLHKGYSTFSVPASSAFSQWIVDPPSEVAW